MAAERGRRLAALTAAALALPAVQASAQFRDEAQQLSVRYSSYGEGDLPAAQPEQSRFDIDIWQLRYGTPILERSRLTIDGQYETLSGASPWFIEPDENGDPVQIMSGATIDEARGSLGLDLRSYGEGREYAVSLGGSVEDDYSSINLGIDGHFELPGKQSSLSLGIGSSRDQIEPTDGGSTRYPQRPVSEDKSSYDAVLGFTYILNPVTVVQTGLSLSRSSGYLSDPYKLAYVAGEIRPDARPDARNELAWTTRLRYRITAWAGSLHLDYRYFDDSWGIRSHTVDFALHKDFGTRLSLAPHLRWYSQSQAKFYQPYFLAERDDGYYSSDYRLSPYGAVTVGLDLSWRFGEQALRLSLEHYEASADTAAGDVQVENPGLVDFTMMTLGFDFRL
ncbi:MAG: DUF3570 domain-containing protein [Pseudomonadota bacterium]|nr:DUF3570 domain-containing protein [Pseudomonadota bacterium]